MTLASDNLSLGCREDCLLELLELLLFRVLARARIGGEVTGVPQRTIYEEHTGIADLANFCETREQFPMASAELMGVAQFAKQMSKIVNGWSFAIF